jgi:hypothetical protein
MGGINMQVVELISLLMRCPKDSRILISVDEEGNGFKDIDELVCASGEEDMGGNKISGYILYPDS